jgi:small subunit ribosomal protein S19e
MQAVDSSRQKLQGQAWEVKYKGSQDNLPQMWACIPKNFAGGIRIYKGFGELGRYMAKVYDVPANELISKLAEQLKKDKKIEPPAWSPFVKTGPHAERMPQNKDWWYTRCASVLRKIYLRGPLGVSDLKVAYGGRKQIGYNLAHHKDAGGAIIRKAMHQLEASGYIVKLQGKGRVVSSEGMKKLDRLATEIHKELVKTAPQLQRYA